jgi:superfamily II DNA or RNA helicase
MNSKIIEKFKKYKLKKSTETMEDICKPNNFKLQPQQAFLRDYFTYFHSKKNTLNGKGLLIYHKIGAGKTCTVISITEQFKEKMNIMVVLPAALIGNFKDELRSECGNYMTKDEREEIKQLSPKDKYYTTILNKVDERIDEYYTIYSYHKFVELCENNKIKLKNTLLVVDEIQNMISESGPFYENIKKVIDKSDDKTRIILLSATPMFDKPEEIALTLNLLKPKEEMPIGTEFNSTFLQQIQTDSGIDYKLKNIDEFKKYLPNLISYYRGAPPQSFPKTIFNVVRCNMEPFQYKSYKTIVEADEKKIFKKMDILKLPLNFMLGPRIISNIAFPNMSIGEKGFSSLVGKNLDKKNMINYSKKFYKILNKVNHSEGPTFVYSNFKDIGGIKCIVKYFEHNGYKNYRTHGPGKKRYAIWSGDETLKVKHEIKFIYNKKNNEDGSQIKVMFGSPSIKEGVSLLRVSQVHILEPYWNMSRMLQIIGRAIRFCSHKDVPKRRRKVEVFLYLACHSGVKTTDEYIWSMAKRKQQLIDKFEKILKENAIDCKLFYNRNVYKGDEPLNCAK